jgi:D-arabinose 1-dehydrogenase-like Zn-dependent alcohol dehydrogenase
MSMSAKMMRAWVAKAAKRPLTLETIDLGPLAAEEVEIAVEHCGLCHSDLSVLINEWGISRYPDRNTCGIPERDQLPRRANASP